jgi:spermidine synthase
MGGLAGGAFVGGRIANMLSERRALYAYALLEAILVISAGVLPWTLAALVPVLSNLYGDGSEGPAFSVARSLLCFGVLLIPTFALGATFPMAVRWLSRSGALYSANTVGAGLGALAAGFVLLPRLGHSRATLVAMAASAVSALVAILVARTAPLPPRQRPPKPNRVGRKIVPVTGHVLIGIAVLAVTGFATFLFEVAWMRLFAMAIGPSTYAFSAVVSTFIAALAIGSVGGTMVAGRVRNTTTALSVILIAAGTLVLWSSSYAGTALPIRVAGTFDTSASTFPQVLAAQSLIVASVIMPGALVLGLAFPVALGLASGGSAGASGGSSAAAGSVGTAYCVNATASLAGALAAGFLTIPLVGLEHTMRIGAAALIACGIVCVFAAACSRGHRIVVTAAAAAALAMMVAVPRWDHEMLAGGAYNADTTSLTAGSLIYYREGATGTVSVKRINGTISLAIDGKVDASTSDDMLTQKSLAHLPLLLHEQPRTVAIIGLGSGVTLGSALVHPVEHVDVIELSPEVVEAAQYFSHANGNAVADPRARIIVGDGRSHMLLSRRKYDVIISEPSNPWMSGVAALFTREFFLGAQDRLSPGGIFCQWTHTYNMSADDLRSIVATFASVFPAGTMWLLGDGDLLLIGSESPGDSLLRNIETGWRRAGVAADLAKVWALEPFALLSTFAGGARHMRLFGGDAEPQTDDRMSLEFSAPVSLYENAGEGNAAAIRDLRNREPLPDHISSAVAGATPAQWRNRGLMMLGAGAHEAAYDDLARALESDPTEIASTSLADAAIVTHREIAATALLTRAIERRADNPNAWIGMSRILAASGRFGEGVQAAEMAARAAPESPEGLEQQAALYAAAGDVRMLDVLARELRRSFPDRPSAPYYAAATEFFSDRLDSALALIDRATTRHPGFADAHNLRGAVLARLGHTEQARTAFQAALELNPHDSTTYRNAGLLELAAGNAPAAAEFFTDALALDPTSEASRDGLSQAQRASR